MFKQLIEWLIGSDNEKIGHLYGLVKSESESQESFEKRLSILQPDLMHAYSEDKNK